MSLQDDYAGHLEFAVTPLTFAPPQRSRPSLRWRVLHPIRTRRLRAWDNLVRPPDPAVFDANLSGTSVVFNIKREV